MPISQRIVNEISKFFQQSYAFGYILKKVGQNSKPQPGRISLKDLRFFLTHPVVFDLKLQITNWHLKLNKKNWTETKYTESDIIIRIYTVYNAHLFLVSLLWFYLQVSKNGQMPWIFF